MIIHGVQPGPMLMVENPQFVYDVVAMMLFSTLGILFFGLFFIKPLLKITQIPRSIIMPIIFVLCVVGSYAIASRLFDVYMMLGFGVADLRHAALRLSGRAVRARPRARRHPRQEPAPRAGAVRRRPAAVLHAADQRDPRALLVVYTFVTNVPAVQRRDAARAAAPLFAGIARRVRRAA